MESVLDRDELRGDAQAIAFTTHAAFEQRVDPKEFSDLACGETSVLDDSCRRATHHSKVGDLGQNVGQLFGNTIREEFLITRRAHVVEGENHD